MPELRCCLHLGITKVGPNMKDLEHSNYEHAFTIIRVITVAIYATMGATELQRAGKVKNSRPSYLHTAFFFFDFFEKRNSESARRKNRDKSFPAEIRGNAADFSRNLWKNHNFWQFPAWPGLPRLGFLS